jgi:DNA-binding CsgD family transcriptional regulator
MMSEITGKEVGLDELFKKKLIREKGNNTAEFRHTLIRDAVKSEVTWTRRKNFHKQIALYLEEKNSLPEIVAEHWLAANEFDKARHYLIESIDQSCNVSAFEDATGYAKKALEIWPVGEENEKRINLLIQFAHCAHLSGNLNESVKALREITESDIEETDKKIIAEAHRLLANVYALKSSWDLSASSRISAARVFEECNLLSEAASELLIAAGRNSAMLNLTTAYDFSTEAAELAEKEGNLEIQSRALGLSGNLLAMQGKFEEGKKVVQDAFSIAIKNNLTEAASIIYRRLASTFEYASDYGSARETYYSAYDFCISEGKEVSAQICLGCMSYVLFQTGEWKKSLEICADVISNENTPKGSIAVGYQMMGLIYGFRGEIKKAYKHLNRSLKIARESDVVIAELFVTWGLAVIDDYESNNISAKEKFLSLPTIWAKTQDRHDVIIIFIWASNYFSENGMEKEITQCSEALATIVSDTGNPEAIAGLAYSLGEKDFYNNNFTRAIEHFKTALTHLEKLKIPLEIMLIEYRLAMAYRLVSEKDIAVRYLNDAYKISKRLSARPFSSKIEAELVALDIITKESRKEDSEERKSKAGLTKRQFEILELLSQGLTNKEIAEKLFLSTRTVDMHVSHILERLNCRRRMEALNKAKELGLL